MDVPVLVGNGPSMGAKVAAIRLLLQIIARREARAQSTALGSSEYRTPGEQAAGEASPESVPQAAPVMAAQ